MLVFVLALVALLIVLGMLKIVGGWLLPARTMTTIGRATGKTADVAFKLLVLVFGAGIVAFIVAVIMNMK